MLGGEALGGELVSRIHAALPAVEIVNMYGPTEACIDATFHIAAPQDLKSSVLPIGRPLSNYRAYVLNSLLEPLGIGVTGELYLAGAGLARGYVNAASLASERFVADPFSETGERLYRTGDLARWRPTGEIEFLGRVDQQLKIRGFRVEPAEIAAVLLDHTALAQAVVVPRLQQPGAAPRLIAYLVPRDGDALPETADLRSFLARRLPDYMVPAAFVSIEAIPLNRNGKLDEKALPSSEAQESNFIAPRTAPNKPSLYSSPKSSASIVAARPIISLNWAAIPCWPPALSPKCAPSASSCPSAPSLKTPPSNLWPAGSTFLSRLSIRNRLSSLACVLPISRFLIRKNASGS